jgi:hypothetical protein
MAPRKRTAAPVDIVLTEEELDAIIRESLGRPQPDREPHDAGTGNASYPSPAAERPWNQGVPAPGAVGDAIRRLLEATTLERAKRPRGL